MNSDVSLLKQIDEQKARLDSLPGLDAGEISRITKDFLIQYTYNSNAIEGSTLSEMENYLVLNDGIGVNGKPIRDINAALGHQQAYESMLGWIADSRPLDEELILRLHRHVLMHQPDDAGEYRKVSVYITNSDVELPAPDMVPQRIKTILTAYEERKKSHHLVECIAWFHLKFEGIHPFIDGNGRTGRLLMNYELLNSGYPPIDIKLADRHRYYDCFRHYQGPDENELPMYQMVAQYVLDALIERIGLIEGKVK